jgi:hypothetical protein
MADVKLAVAGDRFFLSDVMANEWGEEANTTSSYIGPVCCNSL